MRFFDFSFFEFNKFEMRNWFNGVSSKISVLSFRIITRLFGGRCLWFLLSVAKREIDWVTFNYFHTVRKIERYDQF